MPETPPDVAAILPAAGSGQRFGGHENKLFAPLGNQPLWFVAAQRLRSHPRIARIVMPVSSVDRLRFEGEFAEQIRQLEIELVAGGTERTDSVRSGVESVAGDGCIRLIAVQDAARPLVRSTDLDSVFAVAERTRAAILATPVTATVKQSFDAGVSCQTVDRSTLWLAQTPQVFEVSVLQKAYAMHRGRPATDDAELVQRIGINVALVRGSEDNIKITYPADLLIAEAILKSQDESRHA